MKNTSIKSLFHLLCGKFLAKKGSDSSIFVKNLTKIRINHKKGIEPYPNALQTYLL